MEQDNNLINNFKVEIGNKEYFIEFKKEDTIFKKTLNICITRHHTYTLLCGGVKECTTLLEYKKYYHIRRRIYNNIVCINKLRDGLIRKYQVHNELELKVLEKYLKDKNILFRIIEECSSYTRKYNISDKDYMFCFSGFGCDYPEENKVYKNRRLYVEVYKGFVNLTEIKDRNQNKYGIYLY
jgi:superfamily I DNA and/or RNA helicase